MRRLTVMIAVALLAAACGGGDDATATTDTSSTTSTVPPDTTTTEAATTTTEAATAAEFVLSDTDNGALLRVQPGDMIIMRLPVDDPSNPEWIVALEPDAAVLVLVDGLLWMPSEPGAAEVFYEFSFVVTGAGETDVTFSKGPLTPTSLTVGFRVESSGD